MQAGDPPPGLRDACPASRKGLSCLWAAALPGIVVAPAVGRNAARRLSSASLTPTPKDQNREAPETLRWPGLRGEQHASKLTLNIREERSLREGPGGGQWKRDYVVMSLRVEGSDSLTLSRWSWALTWNPEPTELRAGAGSPEVGEAVLCAGSFPESLYPDAPFWSTRDA